MNQSNDGVGRRGKTARVCTRFCFGASSGTTLIRFDFLV